MCFVKKQKWTRFFEVHEPVYPRLVRAFFAAAMMDNNNFTLKRIEILILEQFLVDLLWVLVVSSRLCDDWCDIIGLRKNKIMKKFFKNKDEDLKSKSLISFGRIAH